jgi:hypothetical protein
LQILLVDLLARIEREGKKLVLIKTTTFWNIRQFGHKEMLLYCYWWAKGKPLVSPFSHAVGQKSWHQGVYPHGPVGVCLHTPCTLLPMYP